MQPDRPAPPDAAATAAEGGGAGEDGIVRALPDTLASKIAAGEVVQRPANALKELVENALDAGATRVEVTLKRAGSELVQVADDGGGMGPRDALACFGRHATSKLRSFEDLERLRTLGFRGEALASIASVAQVELKTKRRQDDAATCVRVDGGEVVSQAPCAAGDGTCVSVRNLFYNVPARRAFLKTPATEFKHLVETFQALALSHPAVGFSLVHDDTEVWRLAPAPGGGDDAPGSGPGQALVRRLSDLTGGVEAAELTAVEETTREQLAALSGVSKEGDDILQTAVYWITLARFESNHGREEAARKYLTDGIACMEARQKDSVGGAVANSTTQINALRMALDRMDQKMQMKKNGGEEEENQNTASEGKVEEVVKPKPRLPPSSKANKSPSRRRSRSKGKEEAPVTPTRRSDRIKSKSAEKEKK